MPSSLSSGRQSSRVSIADVARRANVSNSTVSYALNGGPRTVSAESRARVLAAAEELGYSANSLARSLITGRSYTIGVLAHRLDTLFTARQMAGIADVLEQRGYQMLVIAHGSDADRAIAALRDMSSRRLDGIVSISTTANALPTVAEQLPGLGIPFVFSYQAPKDTDRVDYAIVDQVQGGRIATEYLLGQGRRRIAFVGGSPSRLATTHRLEGYLRAHQAAGVAVDEDLIVLNRSFFVEDGLAAGETMTRTKTFDAVFAASDGLAAGFLRALAQAGKRVPEDVAVVGFDNSDAAALVAPPLTSVDMPMEDLGRTAATRLLDHIETTEEWTAQVFKLPCHLVVRAST